MRVFFACILSVITALHVVGCAASEVDEGSTASKSELVVLVHGLGRSDWAMWRFAHRLEAANYEVCLLDYDTLGESVGSVLFETTAQIDKCLLGAARVHFVGHSLGGLVIRSYLQRKLATLNKDNIGEVVLIGTPNKGSELADHFNGTWLMDVGGGISQALVTGTHSLGNNLDEVKVNVGIIAGSRSSMLTRAQFSGPNDGLVSVESTKLAHMRDFITVDVNHTQMRYNKAVAEQTIHFLRHGEFSH